MAYGRAFKGIRGNLRAQIGLKIRKRASRLRDEGHFSLANSLLDLFSVISIEILHVLYLNTNSRITPETQINLMQVNSDMSKWSTLWVG
jgi:hypothetical protein|tara:strand:- start:252 stop:518 length:267 start_codon:yes stop_codon:yes gene_type:complete